ncbi:MAG: methylated-DNA--[protein]-cysteine S-methyltransferase [Gammaproteobacteria bacterium]|nr:methylated-DNA--[protein]-cysteine S-methyltransferase [Gammaproteobacteria bacterium]MCW8986203.1 methylated-DNA--[protein]-cysteine S-methyltransferase [Gammaproteobacteria bacterium]MCW9031959.1 methylated-DNA--[protein]-cysteine S-methyltransferase [Gammaproteobacteria bacterium]
MDSKFTLLIPSQVGKLVLEFHGKQLQSLSIEQSYEQPLNSEIKGNSKLEKAIQKQLENYFTSAIPFKALSLSPQGTAFQKSVWSELSKIPLGETRTYGEIAKALKSSARAVGNACRRNPIAIIIPCHRVVSAKGLGGYAGETSGRQLNIKRWLLNHEGVLL